MLIKTVGILLIVIGLLLIFYLILDYISSYLKKKQEEERKKGEFKIAFKYLEENDTVARAIELYPQVEDFLYYNGVKAIKNPIVKRTFAKRTTLKALAKALGKEPKEFVESLNKFIEESMRI